MEHLAAPFAIADLYGDCVVACVGCGCPKRRTQYVRRVPLLRPIHGRLGSPILQSRSGVVRFPSRFDNADVPRQCRNRREDRYQATPENSFSHNIIIRTCLFASGGKDWEIVGNDRRSLFRLQTMRHGSTLSVASPLDLDDCQALFVCAL